MANQELTPEVVTALGRAAARRWAGTRFAVGRDTRQSGPLLSAALSVGLAAEGTSVLDAGVIPTPGLAWNASRLGVPAAMVSASHNLYTDNGVKIFGPGGAKLSDEDEAALAADLAAILAGGDGAREAKAHDAKGDAGRGRAPVAGRIEELPGALAGYRGHLVACLRARSLAGLRVVLDCAFGAASELAPAAFADAGAQVVAINSEPDGTNINRECGSTNPASLQAEVSRQRADLGLAFDGDADRAIAVDAGGQLVDGDCMLALFAADLSARGLLEPRRVAVTVMTNLGFHIAMRRLAIDVRSTRVGDRYVLEALEAEGLALGGEQSGHIIFRRLATTGDGVLTGLLIADLVNRSGRSLRDLASAAMTRMPQELVSVSVPEPLRLEEARAVWDEVAAVESELGEQGRVLLRPSGTEPVVRVMVEAADAGQAREAVRRLVEVVHRELGVPATA